MTIPTKVWFVIIPLKRHSRINYMLLTISFVYGYLYENYWCLV